MSKKLPKNKWRYGCVKRTYKTILSGKTFTETCYELVEVFGPGLSYTENAVTVSGNSKAGLQEALLRAARDVAEYPVIVEKKPIVHKIGSISDNGKKRK
jgi:hypothetical protein